jgi:hypothetical protein
VSRAGGDACEGAVHDAARMKNCIPIVTVQNASDADQDVTLRNSCPLASVLSARHYASKMHDPEKRQSLCVIGG